MDLDEFRTLVAAVREEIGRAVQFDLAFLAAGGS